MINQDGRRAGQEVLRMNWDEFYDELRKAHLGSGDVWGHWSCSCGASGGGRGPNAKDWARGHRMHLRNVTRRELLKVRSSDH